MLTRDLFAVDNRVRSMQFLCNCRTQYTNQQVRGSCRETESIRLICVLLYMVLL